MSKEINLVLFAALWLAASSCLEAQVYRCEGDSGVVYSDMPCSETAQEIVLDVVQPATDTDQPQFRVATAGAEAAPQAEQAEPGIDQGEQNISQFLKMLHDQRRQQMGEIDQSIDSLQAQTEGDAFKQLDPERQAEIISELDRLVSSRESILEEYAALIQEAQSRLE